MPNCEIGIILSKIIIFVKKFPIRGCPQISGLFMFYSAWPGLATVLPQKSWIIFLFCPKIDIFIPNLVCLYENLSHLGFD